MKNELRPTRVCFCIETTKNVSGKPSNFERVAHVGFNSTAGFNLDNADPKILEFFEKVKLGSKLLHSKASRVSAWEKTFFRLA